MTARDVVEGVYVTRKFQKSEPALYEVAERTVGGSVTLRNCKVPVDACTGDYGCFDTTVMDVCRLYRLVTPAVDELEELLAA